jgi:hypothetical protein
MRVTFHLDTDTIADKLEEVRAMLNNQPCVSGSELKSLLHRLGNVCSVRSCIFELKKKATEA